MRDRLTASGTGSPGCPSLFEGLVQGTQVLSGGVSPQKQIPAHQRLGPLCLQQPSPVHAPQGQSDAGRGVLLTTVAQGLSQEGWKMVSRPTDKQGDTHGHHGNGHRYGENPGLTSRGEAEAQEWRRPSRPQTPMAERSLQEGLNRDEHADIGA